MLVRLLRANCMIIMLFASFFSFSQINPILENGCKTKIENAIIFEQHPETLQEFKDFNKHSKQQVENNAINRSTNAVYTIPVVFHVYGTTHNGNSVTLDKIETALEKLNEDFNGLNPDYNTVDPMFLNIRGTIDIEFKLAKLDPNGGCTSGVIFYDEKSGYGNGSGYDAQIQADAWDNYKYMNVYIQNDLYNDGSTTNSGVAWYPNSWMSDNNLARVVYNGAYLHGNTNDEFASVLTHEFGHWLNLVHTFDGGCTGTDFVADTPPEDGNHSLGCTAGTNCSGDYVNYENYMGYNGASGCYKMFTQGQIDRMLVALTHPTRQPLWQASNLDDTGVNSTDGYVIASENLLVEDDINNGSISQTSTISIIDATFTASSGELTLGVDYNATVPSGLIPHINLTSNTEAVLSFSGSAINHGTIDNSEISITFLNPAISGGIASLHCATLNIGTKYYNPYEIVYVDIDDITVGASFGSWQYFEIEIGDARAYGAWEYVANHLKVETYGKRLVCNPGTIDIVPLPYNTAVNGSSNFEAPGAYPDQLNIRSATHTVWQDQMAYIGFEYLIDGRTCYGWFGAEVAADGSYFTILDYAYNTEPNATIYTGITLSNNEHQLQASIPTFPNPFSDHITLDFRQTKGEQIDITIYTTLGQVVHKETLKNPNTLYHLRNLNMSNGYYLLSISIDQNKVLSKGIIKE